MSTDLTMEMIEEKCNAMLAKAKARSAEVQAFMQSQAPAKPCSRHPDIMRAIDLNATLDATNRDAGTLVAGYAACPSCVEEHAEQLAQQRLHEQGVPSVLLHCTLDNWTPANQAESHHLELVRKFVADKVGFLILLGEIGTGKTHLAVAAMRHFRNAFLVKQNTLLRMLRETYRNSNAVDPIDRCQDTGLLILDEFGLSSGGRDELPMLQEILDHRHGERKPTIITGNLTWDELEISIGARLADRLRESSFRVITFAGASHRSKARERYFDAAGGERGEPV